MIALLIIGNFVLNVIQAQVDATEEYERLFDLADVIFASIFLVELLINMFGTMVNEFVSDWWNWFDVLIFGRQVLFISHKPLWFIVSELVCWLFMIQFYFLDVFFERIDFLFLLLL